MQSEQPLSVSWMIFTGDWRLQMPVLSWFFCELWMHVQSLVALNYLAGHQPKNGEEQ
jgi:hypothetical protein